MDRSRLCLVASHLSFILSLSPSSSLCEAALRYHLPDVENRGSRHSATPLFAWRLLFFHYNPVAICQAAWAGEAVLPCLGCPTAIFRAVLMADVRRGREKKHHHIQLFKICNTLLAINANDGWSEGPRSMVTSRVAFSWLIQTQQDSLLAYCATVVLSEIFCSV